MASPQRIVPLLALACCLGSAGARPLAAQAPGYPPVDTRGIYAEYHAEVLEQLNKLMADWARAWKNDRADEVADLYWENAVLIEPDQAPLRGREAIRAYLEETLPLRGEVEAFMLDFDASGGMAVVYGNYQLTENGSQRSGPLVTVYLLKGRNWKIRSQVFTGG